MLHVDEEKGLGVLIMSCCTPSHQVSAAAMKGNKVLGQLLTAFKFRDWENVIQKSFLFFVILIVFPIFFSFDTWIMKAKIFADQRKCCYLGSSQTAGQIQSPCGNFTLVSSLPYLKEKLWAVLTDADCIGLMVSNGVPSMNWIEFIVVQPKEIWRN